MHTFALPDMTAFAPRSIHYGLAHTLALEQRQVSRHRVAFLESDWLARKRDFFLSFLRAVGGHGKTQTRGRAQRFLVAELGRFLVLADVWRPPARFGLHLRLRLHLDTV